MCYNIKHTVKFSLKSPERKEELAMILGIGMDLCRIDRISKAILNSRFLERVYTPAECTRIASASNEKRKGEIAAGLFAAKEAVSKALGTGFTDFGFSDIEILPDPLGRPICTLSGNALKRFGALGGESVFITITHESGMAAASAVIEGETRK